MLILVSKCSWSTFLNDTLWITSPTSSSIFTKINYSDGLWCKNSLPPDSILKADTTWVNIKNTVQIAKGNTHLLLISRLLYPRIMLYLQVLSVGSNINPGFSWCTSSNKQTSALGGAALQKKTNEAITDKLHSRLVSGFVVSGPYLQFPMPITQICFCMNYALMHDMKLPR